MLRGIVPANRLSFQSILGYLYSGGSCMTTGHHIKNTFVCDLDQPVTGKHPLSITS